MFDGLNRCILLLMISHLTGCVSPQPSEEHIKRLEDAGELLKYHSELNTLSADAYFTRKNLDKVFYYEREKNGQLVPPRLGVALAGGGSKAAAFGMGIIQGLHAAGQMKNIDIISTVSGGSYVGYWLYSRYKWDVDRPQNVLDYNEYNNLQPLFDDCLPRSANFSHVDACNWSPQMLCEPVVNVRKECEGKIVRLGSNWNRHQAYVRGQQNLFGIVRSSIGLSNFNMETTPDDKTIFADYIAVAFLSVGSMALNVVPNFIFDWEWNVSATRYVYGNGIKRAYGASAPDSFPSGADGDIARSSKLSFADLRRMHASKGAPLWIINATAGEDRSVFDMEDPMDIRYSAFEVTPYAYGSGLFGYKNGELNGINPTEATLASAAFLDDQQKVEYDVPARNLIAIGMKLFTFSWGVSYRNPNISSAAYWSHMALPFPLYYIDRIKKPENSTYIHLSDGGQSENLGGYALIRRGVTNIVLSDHAADNDGVMENVCKLKMQIHKQGLSLRMPGLADFDKHCQDYKDQRWGYDIYNWRHPVLIGCIVRSLEDGEDCSEPNESEQAKGKYFARLILIKPSLGTDSILQSINKISAACKGVAVRDDPANKACEEEVRAACGSGDTYSSSPLWNNARRASCEIFMFIRLNSFTKEGVAKTNCPYFPQYGTVPLTLDSSPWIYGALRELAAYYTQRAGTMFDDQGGIKKVLFDDELRYQSATRMERRLLKGDSSLGGKVDRIAGRCEVFGI